MPADQPGAGNEVKVLWTLTKPGQTVRCRAVAHPLGLELRV